MAAMEGILNEARRCKEAPNMLTKRGERLLAQPYRNTEFTKDSAADDLLNDLEKHPHAFVSAFVMDRQTKTERA